MKYGESTAITTIQVVRMKNGHGFEPMRGERIGNTTASNRSIAVRTSMWWPDSSCRDPLPVHLVSLTPQGCHEMDSSREEKMGGPKLTWKRSVEKEMREAGWTWNQVQVWASVRQHFKVIPQYCIAHPYCARFSCH